MSEREVGNSIVATFLADCDDFNVYCPGMQGRVADVDKISE